ncbi:MAG: YCF48-related protein, partial [Planctomycetia bacterium]|nr:YCF48-related protein [Planctomycetia bacterium]
AATAPSSDDPMCSETMRADARLSDVCFVDAAHGWAVGDRGTIWRTADGGQQWQLQPSGVSCPLRSVWFLDGRTGWAAGGFSHPYTHASTGVLLRTQDGGRTWTAIAERMLPSLAKVRFFDPENGFAIGAASAVFRSGAFITKNGGRNWQPIAGVSTAGWPAGDFIDPHSGALAGYLGATAPVRRAAIEEGKSPRFGLRTLTGVRLVPPTWGWLIGDGALVMLTGDLGTTWQSPPAELPRGVVGNFDFAAIDVRGAKCWIAGSPGTRVLYTEDAGKSWTAFSTGQNLPIHALAFVDDQHGWAVGAMGTILATADGGRTWRSQRAGGARAALLGLFSEPADVPWELFAQLSGNEGYLGVVEVLSRRDVEAAPDFRTAPADRLHEALVSVGGSATAAAWQFPLRQPGLGLPAEQILDGWNRANDGRGLEMLEDHLVRRIRLWRPDVIVTHDASPRGDRPLEHLINQAVLEAVRLAADPTSHVEQITQAGLEPWRVRKVYASLGPDGRGTDELTTAQLADRLGGSLGEMAAGARGLVEERFDVGPETLAFHLMVDELPQEQGRKDFFSGILLQPGGEARRRLHDPPLENVASLRRLAQERRNVRAILSRSEKDPFAGEQWLAKTGELTRGMDDANAGRVLYHLAQRYRETGRWPLAARTLELLAERYPNHPLADEALTWLVQYYASGEAAWRVQGAQRKVVVDDAGLPVSKLAIDATKNENRPERAAEFGKRIERTRPELFAEPRIGFPLAVADRTRGLPRQAEQFFTLQQRSPIRDAWRAAARCEAWLADPKSQPPKPVMNCAAAVAKPHLDGRLDEEFWKQAVPVNLVSAQQDDRDWPATVKLAHDAEFLYIAIECRQPPGVEYAAASGPRPRDADLSAHDRVEILLDLDRDYVTYYRLVIDHRGWTCEGCWGDGSWDPDWFVAAETTDGVWRAEAAIGLDQLTGQFPKPRDAWAAGIQRIVPGVGFQSWTTPASTAVVPEGFGLLIFD